MYSSYMLFFPVYILIKLSKDFYIKFCLNYFWIKFVVFLINSKQIIIILIKVGYSHENEKIIDCMFSIDCLCLFSVTFSTANHRYLYTRFWTFL